MSWIDLSVMAAPHPLPRLIAFYHVPKTGGTSVREWLLRNAGVRARGLPVRLDGYVRYYEARCFICLQLADVLGLTGNDGCDEQTRSQCADQPPNRRPAAFDAARGDWRTAGTLAAEFHGPTGEFFTGTVLPHVQQIRRVYARLNGSCVFATLVRDPIDFVFSSYHMWPPRIAPDRVLAFPEWVTTAAGLQIAFMADPSCVTISSVQGHRSRCTCNSHAIRVAKQAVRRMDVVGVTECLDHFYDRLEHAALLPKDGALARVQRRSRYGNASLGPIRSQPHCADCTPAADRAHSVWRWEVLNASERRETAHAALCDHALYAAALAHLHTAQKTLSSQQNDLPAMRRYTIAVCDFKARAAAAARALPPEVLSSAMAPSAGAAATWAPGASPRPQPLHI